MTSKENAPSEKASSPKGHAKATSFSRQKVTVNNAKIIYFGAEDIRIVHKSYDQYTYVIVANNRQL